jgi:hypothetical protein
MSALPGGNAFVNDDIACPLSTISVMPLTPLAARLSRNAIVLPICSGHLERAGMANAARHDRVPDDRASIRGYSRCSTTPRSMVLRT